MHTGSRWNVEGDAVGGRLTGTHLEPMVAIDSFETERTLRRIHASVYVDKASQRAILLGEGGARMKAIGSAARQDMEQLFGGKVFLEIWVRVKSGWADDERMLNRIGY